MNTHMSTGVQFEGDKYGVGSKPFQPTSFGANKGSSKFAQWLIDKGVVATDRAAQGIFVAIIIIAFVLTGIILYKMYDVEQVQRTPEQLREMQESIKRMGVPSDL